MREITRDLDMLLMFDEIVGFRMGTGGLQAHYGIDPDVTTFGKLVGGGFPVGAFGGRADLMERFDNTGPPTGFSQSGTFSAHPVTAAAGLATLRQLTPGAFAHLNDLGQRLRAGLREVFERRGVAAEPVVLGSIFSIHFVGAAAAHLARHGARRQRARVPPLPLPAPAGLPAQPLHGDERHLPAHGGRARGRSRRGRGPGPRRLRAQREIENRDMDSLPVTSLENPTKEIP